MSTLPLEPGLDGALAPHRPAWRSALARLAATLRLWRQRSAARRSLARLSPHELRDIGVSPSQAAFEALQPCWRPFVSLRD